MANHVRVVAILRIVFGALGLLVAAGALALFGGLAGLAGMAGEGSSVSIAVPILGGIGGVAFLIIAVLSLPGLIAGLGLLRYRSWARILTLILSAIDLLNVPFGTALGLYSLWVLLSTEGSRLFVQPPAVLTQPR